MRLYSGARVPINEPDIDMRITAGTAKAPLIAITPQPHAAKNAGGSDVRDVAGAVCRVDRGLLSSQVLWHARLPQICPIHVRRSCSSLITSSS